MNRHRLPWIRPTILVLALFVGVLVLGQSAPKVADVGVTASDSGRIPGPPAATPRPTPPAVAGGARATPRGKEIYKGHTLEGSRVRLELLDERHFDDLSVAARDIAIFRWITNRPMDADALRTWFDQTQAAAATGTELPFATIDLASGNAIGSTRYMTITPEHRRLEIGWTWVGTAFQRTGANREAKLLQLTHAFETLDAERVEFKTHARNEKSRAALTGIGATFEGVLRHHTIMPDGTNRDSAFYSVLAAEWPDVKARLGATLAR